MTGDGFSRRTKYTDDDETIFVSKRAIMMNGINSFITRADLLDRAIILEIERISEDKRLAEDELWQKFEAERPKILGGIFDILSRAMSLYGSDVPDKLPRMADFAKWGIAINSAIKQIDENWSVDFIKAYEENIELQNEEAIQANPVAVAAQMLVKENIVWKGTATQLFNEFETSNDAEKRYLTWHTMWPKDPSHIVRSLNRAEANLKRANISVEHFRKGNEKLIRIFDESRREEYEKAKDAEFVEYVRKQAEATANARARHLKQQELRLAKANGKTLTAEEEDLCSQEG